MGKHFHIEAETDHEALLAIMVTLNRSSVAAAIDALIDRLDTLDGDPDVEPNGDELDGGTGEDEFPVEGGYVAYGAGHPGCPISDPDLGADDEASFGADIAWHEWHTRGRHKLAAFGAEMMTHTLEGWQVNEDDEEDDGDMGIEDDPAGCDAEDDISGEERGEITSSEFPDPADFYDRDQDDNGDLDLRPVADPVLVRSHRDRIRRNRCRQITRYGQREYRLLPNGDLTMVLL